MPITRRHAARLALGLATGSLLAAPHVARAQPRRLRLGHNNTPDSILQAAATGMDAALRAASDGRLSLEIIPNSVLGSEIQMLKAVADGTLDLTLCPVGTTATLQKEVGLVEQPYLFRDRLHARAALGGALGQHCSALLSGKGIAVAGWMEIGVRQITANKPVRTPADLKGLKIRVPLSDVIMESFRAMGAAADALAFPQLPEALRTGRFDAQENPVGIILANALNRYQTHLSLTAHVYTPGAVVISNDLLEELPPADRAMLLAAGAAGVTASHAFADRTDQEAVAALRKAGMQVVSDIDVPAMRLAAGAAQERLTQSYGADALRRVASMVG